MQTILVTGASGFVGSRFIRRWGSVYKLLIPSHSEMDIIDYDSVISYFVANRPDVVLHLAALSNTWYCEQNPDESYAVNVTGAENVSRAAAVFGAKVVFFSSDQVYNGNYERGLHCEDVPVSPLTIYACHKLLAEELVSANSPDAVVLRATWMYDKESSQLPVHDNFVLNIMKAVAGCCTLSFPVHEYRGITWVREVVEMLPKTFELPAGIYNYGASNDINTYETACCFFEMLASGLKCEDIIVPDFERFSSGHERNISVSTEKIVRASGYNICFGDTLGGLRMFLER